MRRNDRGANLHFSEQPRIMAVIAPSAMNERQIPERPYFGISATLDAASRPLVNLPKSAGFAASGQRLGGEVRVRRLAFMASSKQRSLSNQGAERRVVLAKPRGFCAGVTRAIEAVERALALFGPPVYVRRPIVHNRDVIARLERLGAIFVKESSEVPDGAVLILSAHGAAQQVHRDSKSGDRHVFDATCPLVAKVHAHVVTQQHQGRHIILIGHAEHPETIGTIGQLPSGSFSLVCAVDEVQRLDLPPSTKIAFATQTTFSVRESHSIIAAITRKFADVAGPRSSSICYATTNRQTAIEAIAAQVDYVLVAGDAMSSNARRLVEVAAAAGGIDAVLVSGRDDLDWTRIDSARTVGLTAAASTPDSVVNNICDALADRGFVIGEYEGIEESVIFKPVAIGTA